MLGKDCASTGITWDRCTRKIPRWNGPNCLITKDYPHFFKRREIFFGITRRKHLKYQKWSSFLLCFSNEFLRWVYFHVLQEEDVFCSRRSYLKSIHSDKDSNFTASDTRHFIIRTNLKHWKRWLFNSWSYCLEEETVFQSSNCRLCAIFGNQLLKVESFFYEK